MREFLQYIARHLVDSPEKVVLDQEEREGRIAFRLQVGEQDIGKVIGRNGRTAQAMRVMLSAVAAREGKKAILEIAK